MGCYDYGIGCSTCDTSSIPPHPATSRRYFKLLEKRSSIIMSPPPSSNSDRIPSKSDAALLSNRGSAARPKFGPKSIEIGPVSIDSSPGGFGRSRRIPSQIWPKRTRTWSKLGKCARVRPYLCAGPPQRSQRSLPHPDTHAHPPTMIVHHTPNIASRKHQHRRAGIGRARLIFGRFQGEFVARGPRSATDQDSSKFFPFREEFARVPETSSCIPRSYTALAPER